MAAYFRTLVSNLVLSSCVISFCCSASLIDSSLIDVVLGPEDDVPLVYRLSVFITPHRSNAGLPEPSHLHRRTLNSLLRLRPTPKIFLCGNTAAFQSLAIEYKRRGVKLEADLDHTIEGTPIFASVVARALGANTGLSMLVTSQLLLVDEAAMKKLLDAAFNSPSHSFLVASPKMHLSRIPAHLAATERSAGNQRTSDRRLMKHVQKFGRVTAGVGAYLWNNERGAFLYNGSMPPFPAGKSGADTWLAYKVLATTNRSVVVDSRALTAVSVRSNKAADLTAAGQLQVRFLDMGLVKRKKRRRGGKLADEEALNRDGAECSVRSPMEHLVDDCESVTDTKHPCIVPMNCPCFPGTEGNSTLGSDGSLSERRVQLNQWLCRVVAPKSQFSGMEVTASSTSGHVQSSHSLEELLPMVVDSRGVVTLVAVTGGYADMLMNFVCTLRRLRLRDPLVAALDPDIYAFAQAQGLPVFLQSAEESRNEAGRRCVFGTNCFRALTKLKSRAVLRVLKLGYNVLWSDVDITWIRDPLPEMLAMGPNTFPIQCDEWNTTIPPNGRGFPNPFGTMNSGLYFARAESNIIEAFEAIIEHAAARTNQSEQPSFYKVLCGENQEFVAGTEECIWRNGLRVVFLDRNLHPNGNMLNIWKSNTRALCQQIGCASIHNNWIKGKDKKTFRFKRRRFWHYDEYTRLCRYNWYNRMDGLIKVSARPGPLKLHVPGIKGDLDLDLDLRSIQR